MIDVSNIRVSLDEALLPSEQGLSQAVARALGIRPHDIAHLRLTKRSVDARKKSDVHFIASVEVELASIERERDVIAGKTRCARGVAATLHRECEPLRIPDLSASASALHRLGVTRPVVVGFGPAGMFAALYLAKAGLQPVVLERGGDIDERLAAVERFDDGGQLDVVTNIQFGVGGAGTFSDGKLTTGTKSPFAQQVLSWFVEAGAPREILWQAKPHIGTDKLVDVVRWMRDAIEELGGAVRFHAQLTNMGFERGRLAEIEVTDTVTGARETMDAKALVLACGHSARDTFELVRDAGFAMQQKPFSIGVRIEHPQSLVNAAQYGDAAQHPALGAADYKLVAHLPNGRNVYTFCMCPGGEVVCATSEQHAVVVNGMSMFARDGRNANAALLVGVDPADFPGDDALAGIRLQREIERAAFDAAFEITGKPYQAPAQTVGDFMARTSGNPSATVVPTYARGVAWCNLEDCLPDYIVQSLREALPLLGRKLRGFDDAGAVMTGVETRSSSPVRIVRDETLQALFASAGNNAACNEASSANVVAWGVYPCGEGPGYAGGIMSAACDGIRVASAVASQLSAPLSESSSSLRQAGALEVSGRSLEPTLSDGGRAISQIAAAAQVLRAGKPAVFPTDTVWGLGVSVLAADSPAILYDIKRRPQGKPVAWLVAGSDALEVYGREVPAYAHALADAFWPGALTLVVKAASVVPAPFASEEGTIGLRMPASDLARKLIEEVGCPLATTSANVSGNAAPADGEQLDPAILSRVAAVMADDGSPKSGVASTVVDCTGEKPRIVRTGGISPSRIDAVAEQCALSR